MKISQRVLLPIMALVAVVFLSACIVVSNDHPRRHWHHEHEGHGEVIIKKDI